MARSISGTTRTPGGSASAPTAAAQPIALFTRGRALSTLPVGEPARSRPVFCQGWYGNTGDGWPMSETHAPFWIYGAGAVRLRVAAPESDYAVGAPTVD